MKIECINVEQQDNGFVSEDYFIDNGRYQLHMLREEGKFPKQVNILKNDPILPYLYWITDLKRVVIQFVGDGQLLIGVSEELIARYQYALEAAKLIEKQIHTK